MMHRLVFVKHESNFKEYLYEMPLNAEVKNGARVWVRNATGETGGVAASDSFLVDDAGLKALKNYCGCRGKNLARVLGTYAVILFENDSATDRGRAMARWKELTESSTRDTDTAVTSTPAAPSTYNPRLECMTCPFKKVPVTCAPCNACPHNGELQK